MGSIGGDSGYHGSLGSSCGGRGAIVQPTRHLLHFYRVLEGLSQEGQTYSMEQVGPQEQGAGCSNTVVAHRDLPLRTKALIPQLLAASVADGPSLRIFLCQRELSQPSPGQPRCRDWSTQGCKLANFRPLCSIWDSFARPSQLETSLHCSCISLCWLPLPNHASFTTSKLLLNLLHAAMQPVPQSRHGVVFTPSPVV